MKRFLAIVLLLCFVGVTTAEAQRHFVPRYKRQKVEKDYTLDKPENKLTVSIGASANFALGMQNRINFTDYKQVTKYNEKPSLMGGNVLLGVGYKATEHIVAGVETGALFQDNGIAMPFYGAFNYYYGPATVQHRYRFFNYMHLGPQFYFDKEKSKTVGAMAGIGGGMRLVVGQTGKIDFRVGYQLNLRRPVVDTSGSYDIPASQVDYKQFTHVLQVGVGIMLF